MRKINDSLSKFKFLLRVRLLDKVSDLIKSLILLFLIVFILLLVNFWKLLPFATWFSARVIWIDAKNTFTSIYLAQASQFLECVFIEGHLRWESVLSQFHFSAPLWLHLKFQVYAICLRISKVQKLFIDQHRINAPLRLGSPLLQNISFD